MSRVMTVGDFWRSIAGIGDEAEVRVYSGWNNFTLVRQIVTDMRDIDSIRPGAVIIQNPYRPKEVGAGAGWRQLPSGTAGYANLQAGAQKMIDDGKPAGLLARREPATPVLSQSRQLATLEGRQRSPVGAESSIRRVMTVGDLRRAISGAAHDTEVYVYGGEMQCYTCVRDIVTDMRDMDYNRPAAVIFRDPYRPQDFGVGFKQLPPGTRGYEDLQPRDQKIIDDQLPWWVRWMFK
jgi:hypothetical protein